MYDAIVIGARAAGAPTAMLLARSGYRVLLVDRATFPSDTLSTHIVHAPGIAALARWNLLDELTATGCPPIDSYTFDFGPLAIRGTSRPVDGIARAFAPRRTVLDALLVEAAARAGAEVRQGYNVDSLVVEDGVVAGIRHGGAVDRARIVIGADGRGSRVARQLQPTRYNTKPKLQYSFYTYFSNLPLDGQENHIRPHRGFGCAHTHDGLTMIVAGWPYAEARAYKSNVEDNYLATLRMVPDMADRLASARREAPFLGGAVAGGFRKPYGPGWTLVGDAGYEIDPITAQGISNAFLDAERCVAAIDSWLGETTPFGEAMTAWQDERDTRVSPMYEFTSQLATLEPPPPEMVQLFQAIQSSQPDQDDFVSVVSGALSPADFFAQANLARILAPTGTPVG